MLTAVAVAMTVLIAACSSSNTNASKTGTTSASTATTNTIPAPAGLTKFYAVPDPLPAGQPGDIIPVEKVKGFAMCGTLWRVMYHSKSIQGKDIPVTGLIAVPSKPAPKSGDPVITYAHGDVGIADICAQSLKPDGVGGPVGSPQGHGGGFFDPMLDAGYVVAWTDYPGLGSPGRHGESAPGNARAVIAAAMFVSQLAAQRAPELQLVGTVASAPPSQIHERHLYLVTGPRAMAGFDILVGLNAVYGEDRAPLDAPLTPVGRQALVQLDNACILDLCATGATKDVRR